MGFSNRVLNSTHFIKIKGLKKEDKEHYWELNSDRVEDKVFSGKLVKISPSEYEFEGKMRQTIKMLFVDSSSEYYQLDISYNSLSRNIINSLLGYIDIANKQNVKKGKMMLDLSLYINKEGYKQIGISINGARGEWRYNIETQKSMIEAITNKKGEFLSNDYGLYDDKLKEGINEIGYFITVDDFEEVKTGFEETKQDEEISIEDIPF